jgi:hypothetical protein
MADISDSVEEDLTSKYASKVNATLSENSGQGESVSDIEKTVASENVQIIASELTVFDDPVNIAYLIGGIFGIGMIALVYYTCFYIK